MENLNVRRLRTDGISKILFNLMIRQKKSSFKNSLLSRSFSFNVIAISCVVIKFTNCKILEKNLCQIIRIPFIQMAIFLSD